MSVSKSVLAKKIITVKQLRPKYNPINQGSTIFYFLSGQGAFEIDDYEKKYYEIINR